MATGNAAGAGSWREVLADRALVRSMVAGALVMASHGVLTSFGAIQWSARGFSTGAIGMLQAGSVSAEIVAFWFGSKLLRQRDPRLLILLAACSAVLRWTVMASDSTITVLFAVQLLQGVTATGAILGTMLAIAQRLPVEASAAGQGLNAVLLGVALSATTAGSGWLWPHGAAFSYAAMAALAAVAGVIAWPGRAAAFASTNDQDPAMSPKKELKHGASADPRIRPQDGLATRSAGIGDHRG